MAYRTPFVGALALLAVVSHAFSQDYTIAFESNDEKIAVIELSIENDEAIAKVGDVVERFDLKKKRWQYTESKRWVSLDQCQEWVKQSKEKTGKSTVSIPEKVRPFVVWSVNPTFKVEAKDDTLIMTSGQVDYKITATKTDRDLTGYFRYARLNAYKKAMTERKLSPFAELKVLAELERRKLMPSVIEVRIPGIPRAPMIRIVITEKQDKDGA